MAFCKNCGSQMNDDTKFCPSCGAMRDAAQGQNGFGAQQTNYQANQQYAYNGANQQGGVSPSDAQQNKSMGILAYLGILVLVPLFAASNSPFARYHTNQGLVLAIAEIAYGILVSILTALLSGLLFTSAYWVWSVVTTILSLGWLAFLVLLILGIMNAAKGEMKPLPIIGGVKILK